MGIVQPLIQVHMKLRWDGECNKNYVDEIGAIWSLTQATQVRGHLALLNAQEWLAGDRDIVQDDVNSLMEEKRVAQIEALANVTCLDFKVENSKNLDECGEWDRGFGLVLRKHSVPLQCIPEYYPTIPFVSCPINMTQNATCQPCDCDPNGSTKAQCERYSGQCFCKEGFFNRQCDSRNCDGQFILPMPCLCGQERPWNETYPAYGPNGTCAQQEGGGRCSCPCKTLATPFIRKANRFESIEIECPTNMAITSLSLSPTLSISLDLIINTVAATFLEKDPITLQ